MFSRLTSAYQWQAPELGSLTSRATQAATERTDPLEARFEVVLGIVVHGALEDLAGTALPEDIAAYVETAQPRWRAMASEHDLRDADVEQVVEITAQQIASVLEDQVGRRLLSPGPDAHSELALTAVVDGSVQNLIIDRTYLDSATGDRWVVDFKTAIPREGVPQATFIAAELNRYRPQLERYGAAAAALFGQPIRLAIYFTALPRLVELDTARS